MVVEPTLDICERDGRVIVRTALEGFTPGEVKVELHHHSLVIFAERRRMLEACAGRCYRIERDYRGFERTIELPQAVNVDTATAVFSGTQLEVTFEQTSSRAAGSWTEDAPANSCQTTEEEP